MSVGHDLPMAIILGLDVSTSCTGVCVLDGSAPVDERMYSNVKVLDRIEFKGCKTFWDKVDRVEDYFCELEKIHHIARIVLEEPLMGFRPGMSSAQTISMLLRFNGIVSNLARKQFGAVPEYISANHARKVCGIKLQRTAVAGMSQKEQVFKHMREHDLQQYPWPQKKSGNVVDWSRDATDAYVIARAAAVDGVIVPVKKMKKAPKPPGGCVFPCDPPCPGKPMKA